MTEVYDLAAYFENSSLSELSIEKDGTKLTLKKNVQTGGMVTPGSVATQETMSTQIPQKPDREADAAASKQSSKTITAPLVGTFYRAPAPGEAPYVEVGQQVKAGDIVGVVEAMKLMNEITANEDGIVEAVCAEDGQLVEYGEVLVCLRES